MAQIIAVILLVGMLLIATQSKPVKDEVHVISAKTQFASIVGFDANPHLRYITDSQHASGAFAMTPGHLHINPYFANLGASSLLHSTEHLGAIERYLDWYLANIKLDGTIDDFNVVKGRLVSTGSADSTDSYAATFLSLVSGWLQSGGNADWVKANMPQLRRVEGAILAVTDRDGLTWAKPYYPYKLLMDNCEVYRGWRDWAQTLNRIGLVEEAEAATKRADKLLASIHRFRSPDGTWAWALTRVGLRLNSYPGRFYPDAVAQLFPILFGLTDSPAGYLVFRQAHPEWTHLRTTNFPWMLIAEVARLSNDHAAVTEALNKAQIDFPTQQWPWFITESAWALKAGRDR